MSVIELSEYFTVNHSWD